MTGSGRAGARRRKTFCRQLHGEEGPGPYVPHPRAYGVRAVRSGRRRRRSWRGAWRYDGRYYGGGDDGFAVLEAETVVGSVAAAGSEVGAESGAAATQLLLS